MFKRVGMDAEDLFGKQNRKKGGRICPTCVNTRFRTPCEFCGSWR